MEVDRHELECVSALGVVKGATKLRLILDLRQVNKCLKKFRFKLEDIRTAVKLFHQGDYVITFDLKSGTTMSSWPGNTGNTWALLGVVSIFVSSPYPLAFPLRGEVLFCLCAC